MQKKKYCSTQNITNEDIANSVGTLQASNGNWNQSQGTSGRMIQVTQPVRGTSQMHLKDPPNLGEKIKIRTKGQRSSNVSPNMREEQTQNCDEDFQRGD